MPQPIWSQPLFPVLWDVYHEFRSDSCSLDERQLFSEFCSSMAEFERELWKQGQIGKADVCTQSPGYQFRAYLFCLFRGYDQLLCNTVAQKGYGSWCWPSVLKSLYEAANIIVVSFNYECFCENILGTECRNLLPATENLCHHVKSTFAGTKQPILMLKPHGSISHCSLSGFKIQNWRAVTAITNCMSTPFVCHKYPPTTFPAIPDLVPPGHAGSHLANPDPEVRTSVNDAVASCDLLIVCGLSGNEPDTAEIKDYLHYCRSPVVHVGIEADRTSPVARMLQNNSREVVFCDALSEVPFIPAWLTSMT